MTQSLRDMILALGIVFLLLAASAEIAGRDLPEPSTEELVRDAVTRQALDEEERRIEAAIAEARARRGE